MTLLAATSHRASLAALALAMLAPWIPAQRGPADAAVPASTLRQVERGVTAALGFEDPDSPGEWPYEGAVRDAGAIPIGFRVAGTGVMLEMLAKLPGAGPEFPHAAALGRGISFLHGVMGDSNLSEHIQPGFDMRLWGMIASTRGLLAARAVGVSAPMTAQQLDAMIAEFLRRISALEIPRTGGWSYARPSGRLLPAPAYSYVTADVLDILFEARRQGFDVDAEMVTRALDVLVGQREPTGAFAYRGLAGAPEPSSVPGSAGRMAVCEMVLYRAGRSDLMHVRAAIDAFFSHWNRLDERRGRTDLHMPPYGIAPYYFLYAHRHAAAAIELLPEPERSEYRARLSERLFKVRDEDTGLWNDRVYPRSACYGTAAAGLALLEPLAPARATWTEPAAPADDDGPGDEGSSHGD